MANSNKELQRQNQELEEQLKNIKEEFNLKSDAYLAQTNRI